MCDIKLDGEGMDAEHMKERKPSTIFASRNKEEVMRERIRMGMYDLDFLPEDFLTFRESGTVTLGYSAVKKILKYLHSQKIKLPCGENLVDEEQVAEEK